MRARRSTISRARRAVARGDGRRHARGPRAASRGTAARGRAGVALRRLIRKHFDMLLGPGRDFIPVMLYESRSITPRQRAVITHLQREYEAAVGAGARGAGRQRAAQGRRVLARLLIFGALNWSVQWYDPQKRASLDDLTDAAMALFIHEECNVNYRSVSWPAFSPARWSWSPAAARALAAAPRTNWPRSGPVCDRRPQARTNCDAVGRDRGGRRPRSPHLRYPRRRHRARHRSRR